MVFIKQYFIALLFTRGHLSKAVIPFGLQLAYRIPLYGPLPSVLGDTRGLLHSAYECSIPDTAPIGRAFSYHVDRI